MISVTSFAPSAPAVTHIPAHLTRSHSDIQHDVLEACRTFDQGAKGWLTCRELKYVFVAVLGMKLSKREVESMVRENKETEQGVVSYSQVCHLIQRKLQYQDPHDTLKQLFRAMDGENRGFIVLDDLLAAANTFAPHLPLSTILTIFHTADLDRNGKIGWKEFERVMLHVSNATTTHAPLDSSNSSQTKQEEQKYDLRAPTVNAAATYNATIAPPPPTTSLYVPVQASAPDVSNIFISNAPAVRPLSRQQQADLSDAPSSLSTGTTLNTSFDPSSATAPIVPLTPTRSRLLPASATPSKVTFTPNPNR